QAHADRQDRNQCRPRPLRRPLLQAALPSGSLRAPRVSYDEFVAHALGMSDSKPNARRPATPRPAVEAALADDAGAPLRRALWLDALDQLLRPLLPPGLAPHCRLAKVNRGPPVFLTDSLICRPLFALP